MKNIPSQQRRIKYVIALLKSAKLQSMKYGMQESELTFLTERIIRLQLQLVG